MRNTMKLFPNSLYGKFGMKQNHNQQKLCYTKKEFQKIIFSDKYEVLGIQIIAKDAVVHIEYKLRDEVLNSNISDVNIIVAMATTSMARKKLNLEIFKLKDQICYVDTDSLIFLSGDYLPVLGDFIGDFKNETPIHDEILVFESLGPKNYVISYKSGKLKLVAKGFTLDSSALGVLNKSSIHKLINSFLTKKGENLDKEDRINIVNRNFFFKDPNNLEIYCLEMTRSYRMTVNNKRTLICHQYTNEAGNTKPI